MVSMSALTDIDTPPCHVVAESNALRNRTQRIMALESVSTSNGIRNRGDKQSAPQLSQRRGSSPTHEKESMLGITVKISSATTSTKDLVTPAFRRR